MHDIYNWKPQIRKQTEIPGAILHKLSQGEGYYRKLVRNRLNLLEESKTLMSSRNI